MSKRKRLEPSHVLNAASNDELLTLLSDELQYRLGPVSRDMDALLRALHQLPVGLRAMGAVQPLDVSMAIDDLGWHFGNWPSRPIAQETLAGLRVLGASEAARIFDLAFSQACKEWDFVCSDDFHDKYSDSSLDRALMPLNQEFWKLLECMEGHTLLSYWGPYARTHPNLVCAERSR